MRPRKKTVWTAVTVGLLVPAMGWSGWLLWTGPYGPTHVIVQPYVQPGTNAAVLNGLDASRVAWVARGRLGDFAVDYGESPAYGRTTSPVVVELAAAGRAHKYLATLSNLPLDARIYYRVRLERTVVRADSFAARKSATNTIHFVAVGDTVHAQPDERRI